MEKTKDTHKKHLKIVDFWFCGKVIAKPTQVTRLVFNVLEGKNLNLRIMEKEDLPLFTEWFNNSTPEFLGEYFSPFQRSRTELEKMLDSSPFEEKMFIIEKKEGTKIGYIAHFNMLAPYTKMQEIGYFLIPNERGKGYCTEATQLIVDYVFLSKSVSRIQATTHTENAASQKVLEKSGFKKEGVLRKSNLVKGEWIDMSIFSILREEWKEPKILTKTA
jgi:RimJ/RimL family protein N-acetyltransferase